MANLAARRSAYEVRVARRSTLYTVLGAVVVAIIGTVFMVIVHTDDTPGTYAVLKTQCKKSGGSWMEVNGLTSCWVPK